MGNSLNLLSESLDMKIQVLKEIEEYNKKQTEAFSNEEPDMDGFDEAIEEKGLLIEKLEKLDEGFEIMYAKVADLLSEDRERYADKIRELQEKISIITDLSVSVQAQEARNKSLIENYFLKAKRGIKKGRVGSKAAYDYYKNMSGTSVVEAQFLDSKK